MKNDDEIQQVEQDLSDDPWIWLEDAHSPEALTWVDQQNARTLKTFDVERLEDRTRRVREILDSPDKIPSVSQIGDFLYNFWRDAVHPRGLLRRTTLESFRTDEPVWEILLDIDDLNRLEAKEWDYSGAILRFPDYDRALVKLSPDGGDAVVVREFDVTRKQFVEDGFTLSTAKTTISWVGADSVLVATDFGPATLTTSGYPRQVKRWTRGQSLAEADLLYEAPVDRVSVSASHDHSVGFERDIVREVIDFYRSRTYLLRADGLLPIEAPEDANLSFYREWLLIRLCSDWTVDTTTHPTGSLLAVRLEDYLDGSREFDLLFQPDAHTSLLGYSATKHHVLLTTLKDVSSRVEILSPNDGFWSRQTIDFGSPYLTVTAWGADDDEGDDYWLSSSGFLQPSTLQRGTVGRNGLEAIKSSPGFFDTNGLVVEQHFATSKDGTQIPYFQLGSTDLPMDGSTPTLMMGYGGFEISQLPGYSGSVGREWLSQGAVYVVANIRGGGEYGPAWHQAALREHRNRSFEDFAAVAEDLIDRRVTSPSHLGCMGGSNGGLLVGNMLTMYPDLFGAIECAVPLLDMRRYTKISAGPSWIAEYGDPDSPTDWEFLQNFSPYHGLREGTNYPALLLRTATSDDRVGPAHARKMAARMLGMGITDVLFYENREGGHGGASDNEQKARMWAMTYEFFRQRLAGEGGQ